MTKLPSFLHCASPQSWPLLPSRPPPRKIQTLRLVQSIPLRESKAVSITWHYSGKEARVCGGPLETIRSKLWT
jgi:hypothetical protein